MLPIMPNALLVDMPLMSLDLHRVLDMLKVLLLVLLQPPLLLSQPLLLLHQLKLLMLAITKVQIWTWSYSC